MVPPLPYTPLPVTLFPLPSFLLQIPLKLNEKYMEIGKEKLAAIIVQFKIVSIMEQNIYLKINENYVIS